MASDGARAQETQLEHCECEQKEVCNMGGTYMYALRIMKRLLIEIE